MKLFQSVVLTAAAALVGATVSVNAETKQLYHLTAPKSVYDATLPLFKGELDVWRAVKADGGKVTADIYATEAQISVFQNDESFEYANETVIERDAEDTQALLETRSAVQTSCATSTRRHLELLETTAQYVDNAFFDCFRQPSEVYAFFDQLVDENPSIFSKMSKITTTYEGRTVPGYKISTGRGRKPLYTQALIHPREWIAGSSTFYAMAAMLDGLRAGDATLTSIFDEYEWHFVPIMNLDGYLYTWSTDRLWRKNRRKISGSIYGVDLNRNFGPKAFFGLADDAQTAETYPGSAVLSEPETAGVWAYIKRVNVYGVIDMHSFAGSVMRGYGNQEGSPPAPYGPKLKRLGDAVAKAAGSEYTSETSAQMYVAYGCFDDAVFQLLRKPVLTIEMAGESFVESEETIRSAGRNMFKAFAAFAQQNAAYWSGLDKPSQSRGGNRMRDRNN